MAWAATTNSMAATRAHRLGHVGQPARGQRRHRGPVLDALALHRAGQLVGHRVSQRPGLHGDGLAGGGQLGQRVVGVPATAARPVASPENGACSSLTARSFALVTTGASAILTKSSAAASGPMSKLPTETIRPAQLRLGPPRPGWTARS